jgi:hypothetical protein
LFVTSRVDSPIPIRLVGRWPTRSAAVGSQNKLRASDALESELRKLNPAKSKASPESSIPKSTTIKYEMQGETLKVTSDIVNQDGTTQHQTYTALFDGKESPVTGDPDRDSATMNRIDAYTTEVVGTKAGKPSVTYRRVVSKDGKTLTLRETGTNGRGQKVNNALVYDKQ